MSSSDKACDNCGSTNIVFEKGHGFYHCLDCHQVWAFDEDDPDYDEVSDENREVGGIWGFRNTNANECRKVIGKDG